MTIDEEELVIIAVRPVNLREEDGAVPTGIMCHHMRLPDRSTTTARTDHGPMAVASWLAPSGSRITRVSSFPRSRLKIMHDS